MDRKFTEAPLVATVFVVSLFFSYMYKWNKLLEAPKTEKKLTRRERIVLLSTHALVSALIGSTTFYALQEFSHVKSTLLMVGLSGIAAVLSDFILPALGTFIGVAAEILGKGAASWKKV